MWGKRMADGQGGSSSWIKSAGICYCFLSTDTLLKRQADSYCGSNFANPIKGMLHSYRAWDFSGSYFISFDINHASYISQKELFSFTNVYKITVYIESIVLLAGTV